jgi:hypothetical protein
MSPVPLVAVVAASLAGRPEAFGPAPGSTPGIGMWAVNRKTRSIAAVNISFLRMSGCWTASNAGAAAAAKLSPAAC